MRIGQYFFKQKNWILVAVYFEFSENHLQKLLKNIPPIEKRTQCIWFMHDSAPGHRTASFIIITCIADIGCSLRNPLLLGKHLHRIYQHRIHVPPDCLKHLSLFGLEHETVWTLKAAIKGYTENFRLIVSMVESYGPYTHESCDYLTIVPQSIRRPECVTLTSLRQYCEDWCRNASNVREQRNSIPGVNQGISL